MKVHTLLRPVAVAGLITALASCTQYQQQSAAVGALGGAAIGAIAGDSEDVLRGAVIGAAAGTGYGALRENQEKAKTKSTPTPKPTYNAGESNRQPSDVGYPNAKLTGTKGFVLSPYPPYNVVNVKGFNSGELARDTSTGKIFRVP